MAIRGIGEFEEEQWKRNRYAAPGPGSDVYAPVPAQKQPGTPIALGVAGAVSGGMPGQIPGWWKPLRDPTRPGNIEWDPLGTMPAGTRVTGLDNRGMPFQYINAPQDGMGGGSGGGGLANLLYSRGMAQVSGDLGRRGLMSSSIYGQASARMAAESQLAEYQYGQQAQQQAWNQYMDTQNLDLRRQEASQNWNNFMGQLEPKDFWGAMQTFSENVRGDLRAAQQRNQQAINQQRQMSLQAGGGYGNQTYPVMGGGRVGGGTQYGSAADMAAGGYRPPSNQTDWRGLNEGLQRAEDEYWDRTRTSVR